MEDLISTNSIKELLKDRKSIFYRTIAILLSSIFFANIPLFLFLIHMGVNGFFSYDFFSEGLFGLKVFFFLTSMIVLILSISLFGWVVLLVGKWKKNKFNWFWFIGMSLINLFFISLFIMILILKPEENNNIFMGLYIGVIGLVLSLHIGFLFYAKPKEQFGTLLLVIFVVIFMSVHFREQASLTLDNALKTYGVGGKISVILVPKFFGSQELTGKLVLISPRNIYIKLENSKNISTISRERFDIITSENKTKK